MKSSVRRLAYLTLGAIPGAVTGLLIPERLLWPMLAICTIFILGFVGLLLLGMSVSRKGEGNGALSISETGVDSSRG